MAHMLADSEIVQRESVSLSNSPWDCFSVLAFSSATNWASVNTRPPECSWLSRALSRLFYGFPRRGAATRNARRRARPQALLPNATHGHAVYHLLSSPAWIKPAALAIKLLA